MTARSKISKDIQKLFQKEGIKYSRNLFRSKQDEQKRIENQLNQIQRKISECEVSKNQFNNKLSILTDFLLEFGTINSSSIKKFNENLTNIKVKYDNPDKEKWLINILTEEVCENVRFPWTLFIIL